MEKTPLMRTRVAIGVAALAGSIGLYAALPASAEHVQGEVVEDNPGCDDLPGGGDWSEFKIEDPSSGVHSNGIEVDLTVHASEQTGPTFDWESDTPIDAVIVKGGPDANVYFYDPEEDADTGLHAPLNTGGSGKYYGLSHITFCYDADKDTTTSTTAKDTTTTTAKGTTTTTVKGGTTTTVKGATTTTTAPAKPAAPAKPVVAQPTFTG